MYYVYILYSERFDKYYTGQTNNIEQRLVQHNKGNVKSTKPFIPYKVIWYAQKETRKEALVLERKIKNLKSLTRLKKFIEKYS